MASSGAMTMAPGLSEAPSEPEGQASGRDARKERRRLRESTLRSLVNAGVCSQQSAGQLSRQLLDAAISARQQGCSNVPELHAALALEEPPSSDRAWLSARGCEEHRLNAFAQMLQRLEALDAPRPIVSFLDVHLETLVVHCLVRAVQAGSGNARLARPFFLCNCPSQTGPDMYPR